MCGFVAVISKNGHLFDFKTLNKMTNTLIHRGPDDEGYVVIEGMKYFDIRRRGDSLKIVNQAFDQNSKNADELKGDILFGFRRLSILDLSESGHQPMSYMERYWIVFNGEIYNYKELRNELEGFGYSFLTQTDTEVIMASYDYWGFDCFNKFNGMWAIVLLDNLKREIIISRDRFGIKPIYYFENNNVLIFASEIKAIHASEYETKKINLELASDFIKNGDNSSLLETVFDNVRRFPPSSYLVLSRSRLEMASRSSKIYWHPDANLDRIDHELGDLEKVTETYLELLSDAISLRRRSDVKVGAALSGGLDSSSIVYLIMKTPGNIPKDFSTFSNVYLDSESSNIDESRFIDILISKLNVRGNKITPDYSSVFEDFTQMIYHADLPTNSSNISGWYTYKLTKSHGVTVTLDGQGADELMAGYPSYYLYFLKDLKLRYFYSELVNSKRIFGSINSTRMVLANLYSRMPSKFRTITKSVLKVNPKLDLHLNCILLNDLSSNLSNLLRYGDFLSMAHSVESRLPFLDYRLVEFLISLNAAYKIHDGWTKYISRISMRDKLPSEIVWRRDKLGWPNADALWFGNIHDSKVTNSIYKSRLIKEILTQKEYDGLSHMHFSSLKMRYLNLSMWEEVFL